MKRRRKEVQDAELIEYLSNLQTEQILIGGEMRDVVRPAYLLAEDRDEIVATFLVKTTSDVVLVPAQALRWLTGEAPDADGKWFGECEDEVIKTPRKYTPRYWWRTKFRSMIPDWPAKKSATPTVAILGENGGSK